jgi:hypothetical protein
MLLKIAKVLGKVHAHRRELLGWWWWPKVNFWRNGSTSPGNYGWFFAYCAINFEASCVYTTWRTCVASLYPWDTSLLSVATSERFRVGLRIVRLLQTQFGPKSLCLSSSWTF